MLNLKFLQEIVAFVVAKRAESPCRVLQGPHHSRGWSGWGFGKMKIEVSAEAKL